MEKKIYTVADSLEEMQSINLSNLKNAVHREFINDTIIEAKKHAAVVQNLARQLAALEAAYEEEMQASLIEETVQRLTDEVYQLSEERSKAQTALKSGLRAVMGMTDAEKVAAATVLFELMHKYDLHTGMNVDEQTAVIDSFILDVDENHAAQMTATGMGELYSLLKQWNQRVCDKVIERDEAKVGFGTGRMANARLEADRAWRELRTAVNAFAYVQGDAGYKDFIGYMNVLIIRYKRTHLGEKVESPEEGAEGSEGSEKPAWPVIPEGASEEEFGVMFIDEDDSPLYEALLPYGATVMAPEPPEGMRWPLNTPSTMPYGSITVAPVPLDTPTEPLYKFEYRDGSTVLRTDMLPANSVIIYYPAPDGKHWTHQPQGFLTPAEDWYVEAQ